MKKISFRKKLIAIVGPTASSKTEISVKLAQKIGGEIISADSRLIYRDFNIGAAKPNMDERGNIPHYMIDVVNPGEIYTAGKYKKQASIFIEDILERNKIPIIVGGTGFYIKALLEGLDIPEIEPDYDFRQALSKRTELEGNHVLHRILQKSDPVTAEKLHPNDTFRIIRALEVQHVTGITMSEMQTQSEPEYNILYTGLNAYDREFLYERINTRVLKMMEAGLVNEVKNLILKYSRTVSILRTLGYKEICGVFDGAYSLDEAVKKIQKNTRNFAKRQLTWFRANKNIHWFYIDKMNSNEIITGLSELAANKNSRQIPAE